MLPTPPIPFEEVVGKPLTATLADLLLRAYGESSKDEDVDRLQLSFSSSGLYVLVDRVTQRIIDCTLFSRPGARWTGDPYRWQLPGGLAFGMSREQARVVAGTPVESNERFRWDRWDLGKYLVRAGYTSTGHLVTVDLLAG